MEQLPEAFLTLPEHLQDAIKYALKQEQEQLFLWGWRDSSNKKLDAVPIGLRQFCPFKKIGLAGNNITVLPAWLNELEQLKWLDISDNPLQTIEPGIKKALRIDSKQWLTLSHQLLDCQIIGFTLRPEDKEHIADITQLPFYSTLQYLTLNGNDLETWPSAWPEQLKDLELSNNQLSDWPTVWPKALQSLDLDNNRLSDWPSAWPEALQRLNLDNNQLFSWTSHWPRSLKTLYLDDNQLFDFPSHWPELLKELHLNNNQLSNWPTVWSESLQELYLSKNKLSNWPTVWSTSLKELNLDGNQLSDWPSFWPESLKNLDLDSNQLSSWPSAWPESLQELLLNNNQLSSWPSAWPEPLEYLFVGNNQLSDWPESFPIELGLLDISSNKISSLPPAQLIPPSTRVFALKDNLLGEDIDALGPHDIDALRTLLARGSNRVKINEAKLLIVGEPGAGKTSLMRKLVNPEHIPSPNNESTTEGINITPWALPDTDFTANIWDFGGQEIQYATHKFFLTERAVYIIVADNREQKTNFDYWLRVIKLLGAKDSKVIVFLHDKGKSIVTNFNAGDYHERFPDFCLQNYHADLADSDTSKFSVLSSAIQASLTTLPFLQETVDKAWLEVKEKILALRKNGQHDLRFRELETICRDCGLSDKEVEPLARYLNWMGIIIYFDKDHSSLQDFIIIDPEWAVNPLYLVLKHEVVEEQGVFDQALFFDLLDSIPDYTYSPDQKNHLLTLLTRDHFEICYPIQQKAGRYVVPELLPETSNQLDINDHPKTQGEPLQYEFEYSFLPKGLFARLIVRHFTNIGKDNRGRDYVWRSGVLFEEGDTAVKVELEDEIDKVNGVIRLRVYGSHDFNKRNTLHKYREEIRKLNRDLSSSLEGEVKEKIPCICAECSTAKLPKYFPLSRLKANLKKGKITVECESGNDVNIKDLISDLIQAPKSDHMDSLRGIEAYEEELLYGEHSDSLRKVLKNTESEDALESIHERLKKLENKAQQPPLQQTIYVHSNSNATSNNQVSINISINESCSDLRGVLDEIKELIESNSPAVTEIEKAEKIVDAIEEAEGDQKTQKTKLARLKGMIDKIKNGTSEVGKLMDSVAGLKEPASKLIDGYNVIAPMLGVSEIVNLLK